MDLDRLLRLAYSAERAAAFAYRGHARSISDAAQRAEIGRIEAEEWHHREQLLRIMQRRGLVPSRWLEVKYAAIGRMIALSCHVIGRFMPMYFAGRLESGNVNEYTRMAALAAPTDLADEIPCMLDMARVEKEHELYFLRCIETHAMLPMFQRIFGWGPGTSFNDFDAASAAGDPARRATDSRADAAVRRCAPRSSQRRGCGTTWRGSGGARRLGRGRRRRGRAVRRPARHRPPGLGSG
jgi:rubrerythrin